MLENALFREDSIVNGRGVIVADDSDVYFAGAGFVAPEEPPHNAIPISGPLAKSVREGFTAERPWVAVRGRWLGGRIEIAEFEYSASSPAVSHGEQSAPATDSSTHSGDDRSNASVWTTEQTSAAVRAVIDEDAPWAELIFGFGESLDDDGRRRVDVSVLAVTDELERWARELPAGMVRFHPALTLDTATR